jgi:hypothetical protein
MTKGKEMSLLLPLLTKFVPSSAFDNWDNVYQYTQNALITGLGRLHCTSETSCAKRPSGW